MLTTENHWIEINIIEILEVLSFLKPPSHRPRDQFFFYFSVLLLYMDYYILHDIWELYTYESGIFICLTHNAICFLHLCIFMFLLLLLQLLSHFSHVRLCVTLQTAAHQAPLSLGFSRLDIYVPRRNKTNLCEI